MAYMNQKMLAIAVIVTAAALTGIFSTTTMAAYAGDGDSSETTTDRHVKQKNTGSTCETKEHRNW
jgi:hypothetical protein